MVGSGSLIRAARRVGHGAWRLRSVWAWMLEFEATTLERVWDGVEDYARKGLAHARAAARAPERVAGWHGTTWRPARRTCM